MINVFQHKKNHSLFNNTLLYGAQRASWNDRNYQNFSDIAYIKNVVAHRAINMISESASSIQPKVFKIKNGKRFELLEHPIISLLKRPNPFESYHEFFQKVYTYLQISGNAYLLCVCSKDNTPKEIYSLRPDRITVIPGEQFLPIAYKYSVDKKIVEYQVDQINGSCQILHIKNFNPLSDWYGLSSVEPALYSIEQHNEAGAWNQALLQNGARPSGAIIVKNSEGKPANLDDNQFARLKSMIEEYYSGHQNAGKPIVLEGGLEWKEMSLSPKDMDYIKTKESAARDIALALKVPPQLLGIPGDNTYSNFKEARIAFWEQGAIPTAQKVFFSIQMWMQNWFSDEIEITHDPNKINILSEKREDLFEKLEKVSFMSVEEKRKAVGLGEIENNYL